ncbi:MAG: transposase [Nitrososphaeraceae archaeon]|nr:transposase [Nitrososphaeraceae archaeon]
MSEIHIAVDIKKKRILFLEVTSEDVHDGKMIKKLVDNASENNKLKGILADGMYDSNNNFIYLCNQIWYYPSNSEHSVFLLQLQQTFYSDTLGAQV